MHGRGGATSEQAAPHGPSPFRLRPSGYGGQVEARRSLGEGGRLRMTGLRDRSWGGENLQAILSQTLSLSLDENKPTPTPSS